MIRMRHTITNQLTSKPRASGDDPALIDAVNAFKA